MNITGQSGSQTNPSGPTQNTGPPSTAQPPSPAQVQAPPTVNPPAGNPPGPAPNPLVGNPPGPASNPMADNPHGPAPNPLDQHMVEGLRRMGIKAPKTYDPKRDTHFENWLERVENYMKISQCQDGDRTATLLLLLDGNTFDTAKNMGITNAMSYPEAKKRLVDFLAATESHEKMKEKLRLRVQLANEPLDSFARDVQTLGHKAYPNGNKDMLDDILVHVFCNGIRERKTRERVILKRFKTLTEAVRSRSSPRPLSAWQVVPARRILRQATL